MRCIGSSYELGNIRQDGSLCDYIERFDCVAGSVSYTYKYHLPGIFINGLQYELQSEVREGLKHLRVIDLDRVKKLALEAEEKLAELVRLAEFRKQRLISSRKTGRSRAGNGFAYQSNVRGLDRVEEDPWKKLDSMLEKMQKMIKGSNTNSEIHTDATTSLQEASTGLTPLVESNGNKSENLAKGRSGKFQQLSVVDFQFRRDKGLCFRCDERFHPNHMCHSEKVEHIGDIGSIPEGETIGKSGTVIDEKRSEQVEAVEPMIANEDDPTPEVIAHSDPQQQVENEEVSFKAESNETKSAEGDVVEYVAIENDDRAPQAKKLEVLGENFLGFVGEFVVYGSVLQRMIMNSYQSTEFFGYLEEAWDFIITMPFKPGIFLRRLSDPHSHVEDNVFSKGGVMLGPKG